MLSAKTCRGLALELTRLQNLTFKSLLHPQKDNRAEKKKRIRKDKIHYTIQHCSNVLQLLCRMLTKTKIKNKGSETKRFSKPFETTLVEYYLSKLHKEP